MTTAAAEEMDLILCAVWAGGCGSCHVGGGGLCGAQLAKQDWGKAYIHTFMGVCVREKERVWREAVVLQMPSNHIAPDGSV